MMGVARGLVAVVAVVTALGGLAADYFVPWSARQHIRNPAWPPHAKFHNGQTILMGFCLGVLALVILFAERGAGIWPLVTASVVTSLYWWCLLAAPIFPGTAWTDPEFEAITPRPLGLHPQQAIGFGLLGILLLAIVLATLASGSSMRGPGDTP